MSEDKREDCLRERALYNQRKVRLLNLILILLCCFFLLQHLLFPTGESGGPILLYLLIAAVNLISLILFRVPVNPEKYRPRIKLVYSYLFLQLILFHALSFLEFHHGKELFGFIIVLVCMSTILWMSLTEFALLSGLSFVLMVLTYLVQRGIENGAAVPILTALAYYAFAWVLYAAVSSLHLENFLNRYSLEEQYRVIDSGNAADPLTGLFNRRYLKEDLDKELARSRRSERSFCLALMDLDDFSRINDNYGHMVGDEVLRETADLLRNSLRLSDKIYRAGGDEFIMLLPDTVEEEAVIMGKRLLEALEATRFESVKQSLSASIGVTCSSAESSVDLMLQKADKRLARARAAGGGRVVCDSCPDSEVPGE